MNYHLIKKIKTLQTYFRKMVMDISSEKQFARQKSKLRVIGKILIYLIKHVHSRTPKTTPLPQLCHGTHHHQN